jgi:hypothetical protein
VWLLAGQHLVQHGAARVDVGARVRALVDDDLGGEVGDGADEGAAGGGGGGGHGAGQAEVGDLHLAVGGDQHVLGLDVAMDEAGRVRGRQGHEHLGEQLERPAGLHGRLVAHQVAQRAAGNVLHHQVGDLAVGALVEDGHDVTMVQLGGCLRLALEALGERLVVTEAVVHDLDGHLATESLVGGLEDAGHAAARDALADEVTPVEDAAHQGLVTHHCHGTSSTGLGGGLASNALCRL